MPEKRTPFWQGIAVQLLLLTPICGFIKLIEGDGWYESLVFVILGSGFSALVLMVATEKAKRKDQSNA